MLRAICLAALLVCTGGCFKNVYYVSGTTPTLEADHWEWRHYALLGLISFDDHIELRTHCPQGVSRIISQMEIHHAIIASITAGFYTPMAVYVHCRSEGDGAEGTSGAEVPTDVPPLQDAGVSQDAGPVDSAQGELPPGPPDPFQAQ
jgi:hypothetical protein